MASLRFLERKENVILLGPPGVGRTHLAIVLGVEAILQGFSVYVITMQDLVAQLTRAREENKLKEKMALLSKPKLLILDEIGYFALDQFGATCLFQLVSDRYEHGPMILTSNKSYGDWGSIFQDNVIPSSIWTDCTTRRQSTSGGKLPVGRQEKGRGAGEDGHYPGKLTSAVRTR